MTPEEQFDRINTKDWYTAMQAKGKEILAAMQTAGFSVSPDSTIKTVANGIEVKMQIHEDRTVTFDVGLNTNKEPIFTWKAPQGWLV